MQRGKWSRTREPEGSPGKPAPGLWFRGMMLQRRLRGRKATQQGTFSPPRGEACVPPLCPQLCQKPSDVYSAWLASVLAAEAPAGWVAGPCWGSETSSDEAFSCLAHPSPSSWLDTVGARPARGRKDLGILAKAPVPLAQACNSFAVGAWAWHGGRPALHFPGDACFLGPAFEIMPFSSTKGPNPFCCRGSDSSSSFFSPSYLFCIYG